MKRLLQQIISYQTSHFGWRLFGSIGAFLVASVAVNYSFDFYDDQIIGKNAPWIRFCLVFLFNAFPFLVTSFLIGSFTRQWTWVSSSGFWLLGVAVFTVSALSQVWKPLDFFTLGLSGNEFVFFASIVRKADSLLNVVLPVLLLYLVFEKEDYKSFYGVRSPHWDWKPYAWMFGIMIVVIGLASFFQDLQAYYPRYLRTRGPEFGQAQGIGQVWLVLVYELAYGSDFISVELFYRGLLVVAFYKYFGSYSVLLMVPAYVFLHFGKPLTEALSSAVGGYILGIIALHSRNIWGGVILHVGVAWLMEFFGWLQAFYR